MSQPSPSRKLAIIGLDGLTFDLIEPWMNEGLLPNLAAIADTGARGVLRSCFLPLSPPAWTTITTGKNPGNHGVYGFSVLKPGAYQIDTIDARKVRTTRLWDHLNRHGRSAGLFNIPITYPPTEVNGYMVGGFLTPDVHGRFTYPDDLGPELHRVAGGYRTWTTQVYSPTHQLPYLNELRELAAMRTGVIEHLIETRPTDFGMFVFMESDWLQHKVWHIVSDPEGSEAEAYEAALAVYRQLDEAVGRIRAALGDDYNVIVVSDHGAGLHNRVVHINKWLYDQGLLALKQTARLRLKRFLEKHKALRRAYGVMSRLRARMPWLAKFISNAMAEKGIGFFNSYDDVDWSRTRAYARGAFGQIFVNLKGREPEGIVSQGAEYDGVLDEVTSRLERLLDPETGKPIVTAMARGRRHYAGPFAEEAPDLMVVFDELCCTASVSFGFDVEGYFGGNEFCDMGTHRPDGILMAVGPDVASGITVEGAQVADVTPTALHLMGLPTVEDMDGRVLEEIVTDAFRSAHPVRTETAEGKPAAASAGDDASKDDVQEKLKALGYL